MVMTDDMRTGLRRSAGLAGSTFVLGVTFGALARAHGWGLGAPAVASLAIFSGSAQFALLAVLAGGGAAWTAVASGALINLRFFPMALSARPRYGAGGSSARSRPRRSWTARGSLPTKARAASTAACCSAPRSRNGRRGSPAPSSASSSPRPRESRRPAAPSSRPCCSWRCQLAPHSSAAPLPRSSASDAPTPRARADDLDLRRAHRARELRDQGHRPRDARHPTPPLARHRGHRTPRAGAPRRPRQLRHPWPQLVLRRQTTRPRRPHRRRQPHDRPTSPSLHHRRRRHHRRRPRRSLTSATESSPKPDTRTYQPRQPTPDHPLANLLLRRAVSRYR